MNSLNGY